MPEVGFVVSVGAKYAIPSDSNSGWGLSDIPTQELTEWAAMEIIDDNLDYEILRQVFQNSRKYFL